MPNMRSISLIEPWTWTKGHYEYLVLGGKTRQNGRLELPFDRDVAVRQGNSLYHHTRPLRQIG